VDEAHISTLAVDPKRRRQGIGERLLVHMLRETRRLGAGVVTLEVRESNQAAIALYEKHGFRVRRRKVGYYRDNDEDALVMSLDLDGWEEAAQEDERERC